MKQLSNKGNYDTFFLYTESKLYSSDITAK